MVFLFYYGVRLIIHYFTVKNDEIVAVLCVSLEKNVYYSNVDMFEFHDEEKANEWIRWYNREGPIGFSEAEVLLFVRTGPTSGLILSVYPDDNARQAGSEVRQKFQAQQGDYVREITVFEGDVEMKHIKR